MQHAARRTQTSIMSDAIRAAEPTSFDAVVYVQNWENARHLRMVRVLGANAFAVVIAACLAVLQVVRSDRMIELTLLAFLVFVALIQLLISIALKRELEDCMRCIEDQLRGSRWHPRVGLLPDHRRSPGLLHLRWLYTAFYGATIVALSIAFVHRLW